MFVDDLDALFMAVYLGYSGCCVPRVVHQGGVTPIGEQREKTGCLGMISDLSSRVSSWKKILGGGEEYLELNCNGKFWRYSLLQECIRMGG